MTHCPEQRPAGSGTAAATEPCRGSAGKAGARPERLAEPHVRVPLARAVASSTSAGWYKITPWDVLVSTSLKGMVFPRGF